MIRFCAVGLTLGLMAAVTALADDPKPAPLDPAKLVGDWMIVEGTKAGDKMEKAEGTLAATKDKLTMKAGDMTFVFAYKLDAKATPAEIDMTILEPDAFKDAKAKGVVKLADGKVTLCYHPMGDRPKDFTSTKENGNFLFVMKAKEVKKEEKK